MLQLQYLLTLISTKLPKSEKGQDLAEYALLIGLIALAVVVAVEFLAGGIRETFNEIASEIQSWPVPAD